MRYVDERSSADSAPGSAEEWENQIVQAERPRGPKRRRNIFLGFVALSVLTALYIAWQRWGAFDPNMGSQARDKAGIQFSPQEHPMYFWILIGHITGSSIALALGILQLFRGIRAKHPRVHRTIGRAYVFAGVLPAVVFALIVEWYWPFSVVTAVSQVTLCFLWGGVTAMGFIRRRQGRIAEHRRWMYRSYALTCSVLVELAIDPFIQLLISTQFRTRQDANMDIYFQVKDSTENWVGLLIVILVVEGYFEIERVRRFRLLRPPVPTAAVPPSAPAETTPEIKETAPELNGSKTSEREKTTVAGT